MKRPAVSHCIQSAILLQPSLQASHKAGKQRPNVISEAKKLCLIRQNRNVRTAG